MRALLDYALDRLREPSTWRGIIAMLTAAGLSIDPEQAVAIVTVGVAVIGALGAFVPDKVEKQ